MNKTTLLIVAAVVILAGGLLYSMNMNNAATTNTTATQAQSQDSMQQGESMEKQEGVMVGGALMTPDKDIVDNAVGSQDHTTLVAAVQAAGLVETLKGAGPFTVFAPTNAAFEKLPAGTVDSLLLPENKEKLTGVLTYHVVPGAYRASDITDGLTLKTVNGQSLTFTMKDGSVYINDTAKVEIADVISSNGVTHVIDTVVLPK
jgi:uncharacterized surface protein with fasciclin (FAS1) repeats